MYARTSTSCSTKKRPPDHAHIQGKISMRVLGNFRLTCLSFVSSPKPTSRQRSRGMENVLPSWDGASIVSIDECVRSFLDADLSFSAWFLDTAAKIHSSLHEHDVKALSIASRKSICRSWALLHSRPASQIRVQDGHSLRSWAQMRTDQCSVTAPLTFTLCQIAGRAEEPGRKENRCETNRHNLRCDFSLIYTLTI